LSTLKPRKNFLPNFSAKNVNKNILQIQVITTITLRTHPNEIARYLFIGSNYFLFNSIEPKNVVFLKIMEFLLLHGFLQNHDADTIKNLNSHGLLQK
jgi:hypothetical protein